MPKREYQPEKSSKSTTTQLLFSPQQILLASMTQHYPEIKAIKANLQAVVGVGMVVGKDGEGDEEGRSL
ncbi:hypothetical protein SERLA73DRAFT_70057 [Serpula lacrymans var. lacrymans S7.3]|uniref:Uncharacterized protein n=2 Tax=Serpula lacrymans var. lacrymans TaxID=341189 RepID=F8PLR8_SERL3|nr:uncharacterized protein SERLADRAFT_434166 [Serpula lacrymans var. lacrymans S7.9]EGO02550.1 hypothetical protein SERLA73DRAFT_70057 [Serpula lacrymans var. lacrymans S7.3]EGO28268.1 hypothetical protein SERLADRAFT_434166 [Serpula lacrymans var. lacrymans S7.9]